MKKRKAIKVALRILGQIHTSSNHKNPFGYTINGLDVIELSRAERILREALCETKTPSSS